MPSQEDEESVTVTVRLDAAAMRQLEVFCAETGASIASCLDEALRDWVDCAMPMHVRAFRRHQQQKTA